MNKNFLHFSKSRHLTLEEVAKLNLDKDSGNGYYSYSYYILPYSGVIDSDGSKKIWNILHNRHYRSPFTSLKGWSKIEGKNELLVGVTYHHGD